MSAGVHTTSSSGLMDVTRRTVQQDGQRGLLMEGTSHSV